MRATSRPTCAQTCRATSSLSPVRIFTTTPSRRSARERLGGVLQRRIEEGHEAGEHELTLVARPSRPAWAAPPRRRRPGPEIPRALSSRYVASQRGPRRRIERGLAPVDLVRRAAGEDALRRSLGDQQALAAVLDDDGEPPPLEVERDLVELSVAVDVRRRRAARIAASSGLLMPVSIGAVDAGEQQAAAPRPGRTGPDAGRAPCRRS